MKLSNNLALLTDLRLAIRAAAIPALWAILHAPSLICHPKSLADLFMSHVWTAYGDSVDEGGRPVKQGLITPHAYGVVLDIGAGHGHTVHYLDRSKVITYVALEPNAHMHAHIRRRAESDGSLVILPYAAEHLLELPMIPFEPDTVVSILTLCSLSSPDILPPLLYKLLRPRAQFLFYEHVLSYREDV